MDNVEHKCNLYAEYFAFKLTSLDETQRDVTAVLNTDILSSGTGEVIKSFLKISDTVQIYRPVRRYLWPTDIFIFKSNNEDDLPIAFLHCSENIHRDIAFTVDGITDFLFKEGYFDKNPELIPLVVLLSFGNMSKDSDYRQICDRLFPELSDRTNIKEVLLEKIQSMRNSYYKSRALSQLAQFYDEKSDEL
ncbi:unnamed protein product, partial [Didymodactylos carnosus]